MVTLYDLAFTSQAKTPLHMPEAGGTGSSQEVGPIPTLPFSSTGVGKIWTLNYTRSNVPNNTSTARYRRCQVLTAWLNCQKFKHFGVKHFLHG